MQWFRESKNKEKLLIFLFIFVNIFLLLNFVRKEDYFRIEKSESNLASDFNAATGNIVLDSGSFVVQPVVNAVSIIQKEIDLNSLQSFYISFDLNSLSQRGKITVDLCGEDYDNSANEFTQLFYAGENHIEGYIDASLVHPDVANLRLFTDQSDFIISNINLKEASKINKETVNGFAAVILALIFTCIFCCLRKRSEKIKSWVKKNSWFLPLMCFLFIIAMIIFRVAISSYTKIYAISDERIYYRNAERMCFSGGWGDGFKKILYSILIAPFFNISDPGKTLVAINIFNTVLMASTAIPVYVWAKKLFKDKNIVALLIVLSQVVPNMLYAMGYMSEVSYYPLTLWFCFILFEAYEKKKSKEGLILHFIAAVMLFLMYMNKEAALALLGSYVVVQFVDIIKNKDTRKYNIGCLAIFVVTFALLYLIIYSLIWGNFRSSYHQSDLESVKGILHFLYFFYALIFESVFAVVAFTFFPVFLPAICMKKDDKYKKFTSFLLLSVIITVIFIVYTISIREDFMKASLRVHTRYYDTLYVPLFIMMLYYWKNGIDKAKSNLLRSSFTVFIILLAVMIRRLPPSIIDQTFLRYLTIIPENGDTLAFEWFVMVLLLTVIVVIIWNNKSKDKVFKMIVPIVIIFNLLAWNNIIAYRQYHIEYAADEFTVQDVEAVENYIGDNYFIILGDYSAKGKTLETYLRANYDSVFLSQISQCEETSFRELVSQYPDTKYFVSYDIDYNLDDMGFVKTRIGDYLVYHSE